MKNLIVIFTILNTLNVSAQFKSKSLFTSGIIITKNDTIKCFIEKYANYNLRTIKYKINKDDRKALKIKSATINHLKMGGLIYDRITIKKKSHLMENLKKGAISLYRLETDKTSNANIPHGNSNTNIPHRNSTNYLDTKISLYIVGKGKTIKLKRKKYKQDLKQLMSDNLEIQSKIENLKYNSTLFKFDLKELISKYNYWFEYKKNKN